MSVHVVIPQVAVWIDVDKLTNDDLRKLSDECLAELKRRAPVVIELTLVEKCLVRCGEHIQAIKSVRERMTPKPSLREAKEACDAYRAAAVPGYKEGMSYDALTGAWRERRW